jgi:hypothetical protein
MAKKITPEKPPTRRETSIAGHMMRTGKATPAQIRTAGARIESEAAAAAKGKAKAAARPKAAKKKK